MKELFKFNARILESATRIKPGTVIRLPKLDGTFTDEVKPLLVTDMIIPKIKYRTGNGLDVEGQLNLEPFMEIGLDVEGQLKLEQFMEIGCVDITTGEVGSFRIHPQGRVQVLGKFSDA